MHTQPKNFRRILFVLLGLLLTISTIHAMTISGTDKDTLLTGNQSQTATTEKKDIVDVIDNVLDLRTRNDSAELNGKGPFVSVIPAIGYAIESGWNAVLASGISFYTSNARKKLSTILINANYSQLNQYWTIANSTVFFDKQKFHLSGDWRYYRFPTQTFGLGPESTASDAMNIDYSYLRIYQSACKEITPNLFVGLGYNLDDHWDIKAKRTQGITYPEFMKLENSTRSISSGISLSIQFDDRRNSTNPTNGSYLKFQVRDNLSALGSTHNWQSMQIDIRHYIKCSSTRHSVLAFWAYSNMTLSGTPPYLDLPSIGWDDYSNTGRGYIQGRFTDWNLIYMESEYRFNILQNGLLGGVLFTNSETLYKAIRGAFEDFIPGYGAGLRIKMNKYSNTNIAVDYGFGIGGSKGFFFNLGEAF